MARQRTEVASIAGDRDAFERFYRRHVEDVQRFVARRVDDPHLAADLTADVFVAAIESAASYSPRRGEPVAWLFGIARNVVAGEWRRHERQDAAVTRVRGRELLGSEDLEAIDARLDAEAVSRSLYRELDRLPEGERAVFELVALDGLAVADAGRALGIGPIAARVRLHRARRALRSALAPASLELNDLPEVTG